MKNKLCKSTVHFLAIDASDHEVLFLAFVHASQGLLEDVVLGLCGSTVEVQFNVQS